MKKVNYEFVTGEVVEVEVSEYWEEVLKEMDRIEYNNDKKETRRHCTMDVLGGEGEWMVDNETNPETLLIKKDEEAEKLDVVFSTLTEAQKSVVEEVVLNGMTEAEFAKEKGISRVAVTYRMHLAKKKMKKILKHT